MKRIKIASLVMMLCFCMSGCSQSINYSSLDTSSITSSVSVTPESDITNITLDSYYTETDTTLTSIDDNEESKQYAETGMIDNDLLAEICSPMIPEDVYAEICNEEIKV